MTDMKIIKTGRMPSTDKKFKCEYCGCVFKAKRGEYHATGQMGVFQGLAAYECKCPTCDNYTYAD